ncbi:MAG: hypothetical protein HRU19_19280 [Pseudobacteriovorax sp.]|nr:hypothetical protein [Pseudobacteriovorax sp.]
MGLDAKDPIILIQSPYFPIRYWEAIYRRLRKGGYKVSLVEYPANDHITTPLLGGLQFDLQVALKKKIPKQGKAHLIAHGWAGLLVAYLSLEFKDHIRSVTLMSPLGVHTELSTWEKITNWPWIGPKIGRLFGRKIWNDDFEGLAKSKVKRFSANRQATILRANKILHKEGQQKFYEDLLESDIEILILLGVKTRRYRQPIHPTFKHWRRDVLMVPIKKGEHFLSNEETEDVFQALEKFWKYLKTAPKRTAVKKDHSRESGNYDSKFPRRNKA